MTNHAHEISSGVLQVGYVGFLPLCLPVTTIGKGLPRMAITCGVHGDEPTGILIANEFKRRIQKETLLGSISIIPTANPFAFATKTRTTLSDYLDLNRLGAGDPEGTLTERIAHVLFEFLLEFSFVVDIHEFVMETPSLAIYIPTQQVEIDRKIRAGIAAFAPSTVWAMNLTSFEELKYGSSILSSLIQRGIPGFAIETSQRAELSSSDIEKVANDLVEVAKSCGVIGGKSRFVVPPAFTRNVIYSPYSGIWCPKVSLFTDLNTGDIIGSVTSLDLIDEKIILASKTGTLVQLQRQAVVDTGTSLFTIGVRDREIDAKFESLQKELGM